MKKQIKQSSIEWLILEIKKRRYVGEFVPYSLFEQAKAMHKEEVTDAYIECWMNDGGNGFHKVKEAEQYYNETFGGENEQ